VRDDPRFRFVKGDIADPEVVRGLAGECDVVVNFAAESHVDRSLEEPGQFILTDVYGTYVLLEAARSAGHARFLQVSTDEVYGDVGEGRSREGDPLRPRSPYSASKRGASCWSRPTAPPMGSRDRHPRLQHLWVVPVPGEDHPALRDQRPRGQAAPIYGDGTAVRDYIFVEDHCRGIDTALRRGSPGEDYNIGAGGEVNGLAVAGTVLRLLDKPETLKQFVRDRPGHDRRYALDSSKLRGLGWQPQVSFDAGMERTVRGTWPTRSGGGHSRTATSGSSTGGTTGGHPSEGAECGSR